MRLTELEVRHFRNIRHARLEPAAGVNVFAGANAQGKTNMLEAAYYLVTGRSFRTRFDKECIPWKETREQWTEQEAAREEAGAEEVTPSPEEAGATAVVRGRLRRESGAHELLVTICADQKRVTADGKPIARLGQLWGRLNAVLFTPSDLNIVQGGPGQRRQFLDTTLSQISPAYLFHLQRYAYALRQRNALLRSRRPLGQLADHFDSWETQLAPAGVELCRARIAHVEALNGATERHYASIARKAGVAREGDNAQRIGEAQETGAAPGAGQADVSSRPSERLRIRYNSLFKQWEGLDNTAAAEQLAERLRRSRDDDAARGATSVGPHRDDFAFTLDDRDARDYGSQGQQRSAILALRLAEVEVMAARAGEPPVLLLDDIVAELDPARTEAFLKALTAMPVQTLVTATRMEDVARHVAIARRWSVEEGVFVQEDA